MFLMGILMLVPWLYLYPDSFLTAFGVLQAFIFSILTMFILLDLS